MSIVTEDSLNRHRVVSHQQWLDERTAFLRKEKAFFREREQLAAERRALPWEKVEKRYVFDGPAGQQSLPEVFAGHRQLLVYHFMFKPEAEAGCMHCSFWGDHYSSSPV